MVISFPCTMQTKAMTVSSSGAFLVLLAAVALAATVYIRRHHRSAKLPPGPKGSWFGSVDLPNAYQWITFANWTKLYGDVIYIHKFGNPMIVLNSAKAVTELFEKRSAIYSSRPRRIMANELMGFDWLFSSMPYGTEWKKHRALFHQHFQPHDIAMVHPVITKETHILLCNLLDHSGNNLFHDCRRSAAAIVTMISYGHQIAPEGDVYVSTADKALTGLAKAGLFGTYLVDYLSFLKHVPSWMPGAEFKRQALEWRNASQDMLNMPFEMVKQRMAAGTAVPCFTTTQLERLWSTGSDPQEEKMIKNVAAIAFAAGADTTVSAILSFFLAMTVHPEVQVKAQAEIDRIIGSGRLPAFEDRHDLPYIDCIVWECVRWNPVTPLGVAHAVTKDDEYRGYHIPRGTTIFPNIWAILHEESMYPEPLKFNPDRFADEKRNQQSGINELPMAAFGFGRRLCPGRWIAIDTIWLTVATALAMFNVAKRQDKEGRTIEPDTEPTSSFLSRPKPFQCSITPRSDLAAALVRQTSDELSR